MNRDLRWPREINGPRIPGRIWRSFCSLLLLGLSGSLQAQSQVSSSTYLEPYESIEISSVLSGVVENLHVKKGDYVKAGQALLTLNSDVIRAQYEVAKARAESKGRVMAATAERDQQADRYNLLTRLGKSSNSAERKKEYAILQQFEGNLVAAREDAKINQLEAVRIREELEERTLTTPIEGYVVDITVDLAESVAQNRGRADRPDYLIRVAQLSKLKATAFFPYKAVRHLKVNDELMVAGSDLDDEWRTPGKIEFISPVIDAATGTVEVQVMIDNGQLEYKSGVPAEIIVEVPVS